MWVKKDNLDIYNNSAIILSRRTPKFIVSWITILIALIVVLSISSFIRFNVYKNYIGYITLNGDDSYLNIIVDKSDFPLNKNNKLYIKRDLYSYELISISEDLVTLKINLNDEIKFENNIVEISVLKDKTSIFEKLKVKIKKGFGL